MSSTDSFVYFIHGVGGLDWNEASEVGESKTPPIEHIFNHGVACSSYPELASFTFVVGNDPMLYIADNWVNPGVGVVHHMYLCLARIDFGPIKDLI